MKIGIDVRMFSDAFTGIGRYNYELTKYFFENHPEINWVLFMNDPEYAQFDFPLNVKKVKVNAKHYSFSEQFKFWKILEAENCDLVHFTHFNTPILYKKPFVTTIHDTTISFYPGKKMNSWWRKLAYKIVIRHAVFASKKIIAVSDNTKKDIENLFEIPSEKIKTIWNGLGDDFYRVELDKINLAKQKFNLSDNFLLYTGVWREHKNVIGLIESFNLLLQDPEMPDDLELVITGKKDPSYLEVIDLINTLGLTSKVKLVGLVDFADLLALYSGANLFVFPSFYEGFGFPPLEAMKVNTPVVASRSASIPEVCGNAAHYFNPHDVVDMKEKIKEALLDESLRMKLKMHGRERVKLFSWETCAQETFNIYKK